MERAEFAALSAAVADLRGEVRRLAELVARVTVAGNNAGNTVTDGNAEGSGVTVTGNTARLVNRSRLSPADKQRRYRERLRERTEASAPEGKTR